MKIIILYHFFSSASVWKTKTAMFLVIMFLRVSAQVQLFKLDFSHRHSVLLFLKPEAGGWDQEVPFRQAEYPDSLDVNFTSDYRIFLKDYYQNYTKKGID